MINHGIADLIKIIHTVLVLYILTGHYFTPIKYLKYYLLLVIFIFLDWNDFDGMCILTKLEHYFRTGVLTNKAPLQDGPEFFRPLIKNLFNLNLTSIEADRLNNFVFMFCFLLGFYRLINHYKI